MSDLADQAFSKLFWFCLKIGLLVAIVCFVAWWLVVISAGIGFVVGCYKYAKCAMGRRASLSSVRKNTEAPYEEIEGAFFRHHYRILHDVDCEVTGDRKESITPGDETRPIGRYGGLRPLSPLSYVPWITKLLYTSCARVGFTVCFCISMIGVGVEVRFRRLRGMNKAKKVEQDA